MRPALVLLAALGGTALPAQSDLTDQIIEDVIAQEAEDGGEFSYNAAFDLLEAYERRPLDLNRATGEELAELLLLSPTQIDRLLEYRERMEGFLSIYELQAVPGLDLEAIRTLLPYVVVDRGLDDISVPLRRLLTEGTREVYLRAGQRLERARGYETPDPAYAGNPLRLYTRFRQRYGNQLSLGLVAEKDPGERLWRERGGPDYLSAHFFLRNLDRRVRAVALGDFSVSFGQGLILYTGFGFGKSSLSTRVARTAPTLQPYASVNEFNFMRGAGVTLAFGDKVEATLFGSRRSRSGNLTADSSGVTSLPLSGYHRTRGEREDRNALTQTSYGGSLRYRPFSRLHLALNYLGEHLSAPLQPSPRPYNLYYFRGTDLHNVSVDYRYRLRNFSFFGEAAGAISSGMAMLHGINLGVDPRADIALVYRKYDRDYRALSAQPFGETSGGRNEEGVYLGVELRPAVRWRVNAFYDLWRHDWLRYNVDAPSSGREYRLRVSYFVKRKLDSYVELRGETKGHGVRGEEEQKLDQVIDRTRFQARLHAGYRFAPGWEWRGRLDAGFTQDAREGRQRGVMLFQDLHYRPLKPFSFSARLAAYATDSYDVRFYEYENGLTYNAYVLPYYGHGVRGYFLTRYKGIRGLTIELRVARTQNTDGETFGRGWEDTDRTHRTDISGQVIYRW